MRARLENVSRRDVSRFVWAVALLLLCVWVAVRLGIFDLTTRVMSGGREVTVPNAFSYVDHPFHESRAVTLLESLKDGHLLRWMGQHQGGYPVEFYPLGVPWLDVLLWAALFGSIPMIAVHKVTVILLFLLPALSFWLAAKGDRIHPATAFLAAAIHFAVPGTWLNGGLTELVSWGLVTNVAGGSFSFLATILLARFVLNRESHLGGWAIAAAAMAAVCNPRSLFSLVTMTIAIAIIALIASPDRTLSERARQLVLRLALVGGGAFLLAAPVVLALFRYNGLYYFKHYEGYPTWDVYRTAMITAVSMWTYRVAIVGVVVGLLSLIPQLHIQLSISRALALGLVFYVAFTWWVASATSVPPLVEQLEAPRLMPFQRQLMIWLAAMAVFAILTWSLQKLPSWTWEAAPAVVCLLVAAWFMSSWVINNDSVLPEEHGLPIPGEAADANGVPFIGLTGIPEFQEFVDAMNAANGVTADGGSMLLVGNRQDWWHEQLWAPSYTSSRLYYDDWMWYWHIRNQGPYDPAQGYFVTDAARLFDASYLQQHGIQTVLVTDMYVPAGLADPRLTARSAETLTFVETFGHWDVYTVKNPTAQVMVNDHDAAEISVTNERITATIPNAQPGDVIEVRQNWYPRWTATVNGESAKIERRDDGYMDITVPDGVTGDLRLEVVYGTTAVDWLARLMSVAGVVVLAVAALGRRWLPFLRQPVELSPEKEVPSHG